ncbi:MAG: esterase-like activity of phytase family protein [Paracoccaceae bacterium]
MRAARVLICAALAGMLAAPSCGAAELVERGVAVWEGSEAEFGGFSGLAVDADGGGFLAINDIGWIYHVVVRRDEDGRIAAIGTDWHRELPDKPGSQIDSFERDAEALTRGADGTLYLGYESLTRVVSLRQPDLVPTYLHDWQRFRPLWGNESIEALAARPEGGLIAVLEVAGEDGGYATLMWNGGDWTDGAPIDGAGDYAASDATFGPDGRLYLLERRVTFFGNFATRIRRFDWNGNGAVGVGEVLLETDPGTLDNMEGICVWRDAADRSIVTLISDDNFRSLQTTIVAEYEVRE